MKPNFSTLFIASALLTSVYGANSPIATLKISELTIQTEKIRQNIQEEEKAWAEEKSREIEAEKSRKERYEKYTSERSQATSEIVVLDQNIQARMDQIEHLKIRTDNLHGQIKFLQTVILEEVRNYMTLIQEGFPYRKDKRMEVVDLLIDDLVKERISPEEGFNRLWVQYLSEHATASEAEVFSGSIDIGNGKQTQVKFLRLGKQLMAYTTPTGEHLGLLMEVSKGKWEYLRESQMDFETRAMIRNALAVAEGKAVPAFVRLPTPLKSFDRN